VQVAAIYSVGLSGHGFAWWTASRSNTRRLKVHVSYLHPEQVYEQIQQGTADFGLVSFPAPVARADHAAVGARRRSCWPARRGHLFCPAANDPAGSIWKVRNSSAFEKNLDIRREIDRYLRQWRA